MDHSNSCELENDRKSYIHDLKPSGCTVSSADIPLILPSIACFMAFIAYGGCVASLGAALPTISSSCGLSESGFGLAFTTRGVGYLIGTLGSAAIAEMPSLKVSKQFGVCIAISLTGLSTGIISAVNNFQALLFLFWLQGVGFGGVDTLANCVLPELWKTRVQPWMQALHACFGIGAVIGPALVGFAGFRNAFIILAFMSAVPLFVMLLYSFYMRILVGSLIEIEDRKGIAMSDELNSPESTQEEPPIFVPVIIRILITFFYFFYVGSETGFGAWISTFVIHQHITDSESQAAFLSSVFWAALTFGRIIAIPLAVFFSTSSLLRCQLVFSVIAAILIVAALSSSFDSAFLISAFFGYALSSIFPLMMTLVSDYGFTMQEFDYHDIICCGQYNWRGDYSRANRTSNAKQRSVSFYFFYSGLCVCICSFVYARTLSGRQRIFQFTLRKRFLVKLGY